MPAVSRMSIITPVLRVTEGVLMCSIDACRAGRSFNPHKRLASLLVRYLTVASCVLLAIGRSLQAETSNSESGSDAGLQTVGSGRIPKDRSSF
jgi:hypothetical protein